MERHFEEVTLPSQNQMVLPDGSRFPAAFVPRSDRRSLEDLLELIEHHRGWIKEQVVARGALLFRGWQVKDGNDFSAVFNALGYKEVSYEQGQAARNHVTGAVYTSNEDPVDKPIGFHNELAYLPLYPEVIIFFCQTPSRRGGGTGLLHGKAIYERLVKEMPEFVQKLEEHKVEYVGATLKDWRDLFNTSDRAVAEERAKAVKARLKWNEDGNPVTYRGPFAPTLKHPVSGETNWFNSMGLLLDYVQSYRLHLSSDGSPVPVEEIRACCSLYDKDKVVVEWERGDFVIVDNLSVMHSRVPGEAPRVVLVALGNNV